MRLAMVVIARRRHTEDVPLLVYQRYQSSPQLRIIRSIKQFANDNKYTQKNYHFSSSRNLL